MNDYQLTDLGTLIEQTRDTVAREFNYCDICLSSMFKDAVTKWEESCGNTIVYTETGFSVTTSNGKIIYAPNQWFLLASYVQDLLREVMRYREYTEKIITPNLKAFRNFSSALNTKKNIYDNLKHNKDPKLEALFRKLTKDTMTAECSDADVVNANTDLLYRFVSDTDWWLDGKGLDRTNDFYVSTVLNVLNLSNHVHSYVATIAYAYMTNDELKAALPFMIESSSEADFNTGLQCPLPRNRIIYGAPGTGKSYMLNREMEELLGINNCRNYERVTFYQGYAYSNFVGTYKPAPYKNANGKNEITYQYVAGPFMRLYVKALKSARSGKSEPFLLIIEEINRADAAAVFGDFFQLLDRDDDNVSMYPIQASEDVKQFLARPDQLGGSPEDYEQLRLPDNLFIWATMNNADQRVFALDSAFQRRWDYTYIGINDNDEELKGKYVILGKGEHTHRVEWNRLRIAINDKLSALKVNEDKLIGPYFLSRKLIVPANGNEIKSEDFISAFKNKVLMYLYDDAARQKRSEIFRDGKKRFSEICEDFDEFGVDVFSKDIADASGKIYL